MIRLSYRPINTKGSTDYKKAAISTFLFYLTGSNFSTEPNSVKLMPNMFRNLLINLMQLALDI